MVFVDSENGHTWKTVRVGKIRSDGQFDIVWSSDRPVRPTPFPATRTRAQWDAFLQQMYAGWGNRWYNPGSEGPSPAVKSVPYR
jgi:hypothetical protein